MISVMCPNITCCKLLQVPEKYRGKIVQCRHCKKKFKVPEKKKPAVNKKVIQDAKPKKRVYRKSK